LKIGRIAVGNGKSIKFRKEEIAAYVGKFKAYIMKGRFIVSNNSNRELNMQTRMKFLLTDEKIKNMLLDVAVEDFCYAVRNEHPKFAHETLYVFCRAYSLFEQDEERQVDFYIKINLIEGDRVIVVSLHEALSPMKRLFKQEKANASLVSLG
jgi:hypothetical protein